ncbi:hypothetical protein [Deinococcus soli (ex Cha et al. 2016)]|uniref:Uncharacterized protein n=2 Tax=Deinococcus soli (ex Cha et al. 2016) TaxID=1309411 RepID=A0ACC6KKZ4_9DEIO|nr:hypothetical protein [Deinococcus soli (ex Cha et al. 2016)]MDR6218684.1 hypothetical protein [Deinococcus soli (ex Cha et al. 2016)]MDR6328481.1 hypothetical protein [Deinococcus soli (ex Cha et al. 2016)]MDR6753092.1 hypothetical protein [Deinococcus soli (ex Cha et al. 2016)]
MIYIREYGLTEQQRTWWASATTDERDAFFLSAPVRIAVQDCTFFDQAAPGHLFAPTIHGIPVGTEDMWRRDPHDAQRIGDAWQAKRRERLAGRAVPLDLTALGIQGPAVPEYATPGGEEAAFFADMDAAFSGRGPSSA